MNPVIERSAPISTRVAMLCKCVADEHVGSVFPVTVVVVVADAVVGTTTVTAMFDPVLVLVESA